MGSLPICCIIMHQSADIAVRGCTCFGQTTISFLFFHWNLSYPHPPPETKVKKSGDVGGLVKPLFIFSHKLKPRTSLFQNEINFYFQKNTASTPLNLYAFRQALFNVYAYFILHNMRHTCNSSVKTCTS